MKKFDFKQRINSFLLREEGKISKKSILKAGIVLGAIALSLKTVTAHGQHCSNSLTIPSEDCGNTAGIKCPANGHHGNNFHDNNLNVKNMFGKLVLGHNNCAYAHSNHASHGSHGNNGHSQCCFGPSGA